MRRHLWVLLGYLGLSLLLTWPMAVHMASHVPGDGIDDPSLAWNLWWLKHALVDQPQNPFASNWVFWPVGINLAFYTLTILNGLLGIPLQVTAGIVPAYNILLLSAFTLAGYGAYLLCLDALSALRPLPGTGMRYGARGSPPDAPDGVEAQFKKRRRRLPLDLAAFAGGSLYAFASAKMFYAALGQGNVASSQWVPFAALYIVRCTRPQGRWRDAALAGLFIVLQAYAEQTFASFLLIFAALALLWRLVPLVIRRERWWPTLARFALMGALFFVGILPFLANMLPDLRTEGDFFTAGGGFADVFSADLAGYLLPTQLHPVLGGLARQIARGAGFPIDKGQQIFAGYAALALAVVGLLAARSGRAAREATGHPGAVPSKCEDRGWPGPWFWAASTALFFLLTLGPTLRVAGHDLHIPLPFALVAELPFFKGNRYPSRYSVMLLVSLAPLVAAGMAVVLQKIEVWWRAPSIARRTVYLIGAFAGILALLLFEQLSAPLPLSDLRVPALYNRLAGEPGDFAVLELPPGWRNGARVLGKQDVVIMQELWNQTVHGKRVLGGNTSRNPEFKFQYFAEDPTLSRLLAPTSAADLAQHGALRTALAGAPISDAERARARAWAAFLDLRYVMVHRDELPPETEATLRALLPVRAVAESGNLALYAIDEAAVPSTFAPGTDAGRMVLAEGWSPPEPGYQPEAGDSEAWAWAERSEPRLLLPLGPGASTLRLYGWSPSSGQRVAAELEGLTLGDQALGQQPGWLSFSVPANPARPPLSEVTLRFARLTPAGRLRVGDALTTSLDGLQANLLVRSAGAETGDFAHIYVDGLDLSSNQRGYNLLAYRPGDGASATGRPAWEAASFDTHLDPAASDRLAAWVASLPVGTVVAGAVRDEASMNLKPQAVEALRSLGVATDLRGHFRWGHAFIGMAGAPPGSAREVLDGVRPAQVSAGHPASAPEVAGAFSRIEIVPYRR